MRRTLLLEVADRSHTDLLAMLAAIETCLIANDIRSVRIELDGRAYAMAAPDAKY